MGMLCTAVYILSMNNFGPIADNAGGIVEMSNEPDSVREITDRSFFITLRNYFYLQLLRVLFSARVGSKERHAKSYSTTSAYTQTRTRPRLNCTPLSFKHPQIHIELGGGCDCTRRGVFSEITFSVNLVLLILLFVFARRIPL